MRPVRPAHYADSFWCTYMISVGAAFVAEAATYPLDLTKTRLQIQGEAMSAAGKTTVSKSVDISIKMSLTDKRILSY